METRQGRSLGERPCFSCGEIRTVLPALRLNSPYFTATYEDAPQARSHQGKGHISTKRNSDPSNFVYAAPQVKRGDPLVTAGRTQGYSPNLSAGRRSPRSAKRAAGAPTCPRTIWRVTLCPADGIPKHAMLLMCSKANAAKIQSAHVV